MMNTGISAAAILKEAIVKADIYLGDPDPVCPLKTKLREAPDLKLKAQVEGQGLFQLVIAHADGLYSISDEDIGKRKEECAKKIEAELVSKRTYILSLAKELPEQKDDKQKKSIKEDIKKTNEQIAELEKKKAELTNKDLNKEAKENNLKILNFCIKDEGARKILINDKDANGKLPMEGAIELAIKHDATDVLTALLKGGAKTDILIGPEKKSCFQYALELSGSANIEAAKANFNTTLTILTKGPAQTPNISNKLKKYPSQISKEISTLLKARSFEYQKTLRILCQFDGRGNNFFHSAIESGQAEALTWLTDFLKADLFADLPALIADYIGPPTKEEDLQRQKITEEVKKQLANDQAKLKEYFAKKQKLLLAAPNVAGFSPEDLLVLSNNQDPDFIESFRIILEKPELSFEESLREALEEFKAKYQASNGGEITNLKALELLVKNASKSGAGESTLKKLRPDRSLSDILHYAAASGENSLVLDEKVLGPLPPQKVIKERLKDTTSLFWKSENGEDYTAFEIALINKNSELIDVLLQQLAEPALKIMLGHTNAKTAENILHIAAQYFPEKILEIAQKINEVEGNKESLQELSGKKNKEGKTPQEILLANNQGLIAAQLEDWIKPEGGKARAPQLFDRPAAETPKFEEHDFKEIYNYAKQGNINEIAKLAQKNPDIIYTSFLEGGNNNRISVLELAAQNNQGEAVRFIIAEHKKLRQQLKEIEINIFDLEAEIGKITAQIPRLLEVERRTQQGIIAANEFLKEGKIAEKATLQNKIKEFQGQIQKVALKILPSQPERSWHNEVLQIAALMAETIQTYIDQERKNPLTAAVKSGNSLVIDKLSNIKTDLAVQKFGDEEKTPYELAEEQGDVETCLKFGQSPEKAYSVQKQGSSLAFTETPKPEQMPLKKSIARDYGKILIEQDLLELKSAVTEPLVNKGKLLPYVNALLNDDHEGKNFNKKISEIKDKSTDLIKLESGDGHNIATLIAAFGNTSQWEKFEAKYDKLGAKPARKACDLITSGLGSPMQVALIAKYHHVQNGATAEAAARQRFIHYLIEAKKPSLEASNAAGDTIFHTIAQCRDLEALQLIFDDNKLEDIFAALTKRNNKNETALTIAVRGQDLNLLQCITNNFKFAENPRLFQNLILSNSDILHSACLSGNLEMVKLIFGLQSQFFETVNEKQREEEKLLLEKLKDTSGKSPFALAFLSGNEELIKYFVEQKKDFTSEGAKIQEPQIGNLLTFLANTANISNASSIIRVLELKIGVNDLNPVAYEKQLLEIAINSKDVELLKFTLEKLAIKSQFPVSTEVNAADLVTAKEKILKVSLAICKTGNIAQLDYLLENNFITTADLSEKRDSAGKSLAEALLETPDEKKLAAYKRHIGEDAQYERALKEFQDLKTAKLQTETWFPSSSNIQGLLLDDTKFTEFKKELLARENRFEREYKSYEDTAILEPEKNWSRAQQNLLALIDQNSKSLEDVLEFRNISVINPGILSSQVQGIKIIDQLFTSGNASLLKAAAAAYGQTLTDENGDTFLHKILNSNLADRGKIEIFNECRKNGASLIQANNKGETAFSLSQSLNVDMAELNKMKLAEEELHKKIVQALSNSLRDFLKEENPSLVNLANLMRHPHYYNNSPVLTKLITWTFEGINSENDEAIAKKFSLINRLIKSGIPSTEVDPKGNNILHQLFVALEGLQNNPNVIEYTKDIIETLLKSSNKEDKKLLLFSKNQAGYSPLGILASVNNANNIQELIKKDCEKSNINIEEEINPLALLRLSVGYGNYSYCKWLLENYNFAASGGSSAGSGAAIIYNINSPDKNGDSVLRMALFSFPADFNKRKDIDKEAIIEEKKNFIDLLLANGADINELDKYGRSLLQNMLDDIHAGGDWDPALFSYLIEAGASLNYKNKKGGNLGTLDSLKAICEKRALLGERLKALYINPARTINEEQELENLKKLKLNINLEEEIQKAQAKRITAEKQLEESIKAALQKPSALDKAESLIGKATAIIIDATDKIEGAIKGGSKLESYTCSLIGGVLHLKTANTVKTKALLASSPRINKVELNLDGTKVTLERQRIGNKEYRNYVVTDGVLIIELEHHKIRVTASGKIEFADKKDQEKFEAGKLKLAGVSEIYVGGRELIEVLKAGRWHTDIRSMNGGSLPDPKLASNPKVDIKRAIAESPLCNALTLEKEKPKPDIGGLKPTTAESDLYKALDLENKNEVKQLGSSLKSSVSGVTPHSGSIPGSDSSLVGNQRSNGGNSSSSAGSNSSRQV